MALAGHRSAARIVVRAGMSDRIASINDVLPAALDDWITMPRGFGSRRLVAAMYPVNLPIRSPTMQQASKSSRIRSSRLSSFSSSNASSDQIVDFNDCHFALAVLELFVLQFFEFQQDA